MAATPTARAVLDEARSQLGVRERPPGSNRVKYTAWYHLVGPWCAMFVSWVAWRAGAARIIPRASYCPSVVAWYRHHGRWGATPRPGAQVVYDFIGRPSHTGIVESVHGSLMYVIEGNTDAAGGRTGGRVMRKARLIHSRTVVGFGYPAYAGAHAVHHAGPASYTRVLRARRPMMHGADVRRVQRAVGATADGWFGPETGRRVRAWQRRHHLHADAQVGPKTWAALFSA